ncbi:MAG: outer membrane lipoprotein carrier protein LolA [Bacteroidales bacterium]|nr:outer membrane lipoprotein carrier protein LolA [Bacteroidales bacterium]
MRRYGLLSVFCILTFCAFSQQKPLKPAAIASLKESVRNASQKTQTITSDFVQVKSMNMLNESIRSEGKFLFKKEKMLRWEYLHPFSYLIIINNDHILIKDDKKVNQFNLQSNKVFLEINRIIIGSIQGTLLQDETNFQVSFFEQPQDYIVKLKPLSQKLKTALSEIIIFFDRKDFSVNGIEMNEPGGDVTKINFKNKKLNQPIANEKFILR